MSFFTELKQRNVFKVAIAYTVVGWLLIQVAEVVAPQMNLPDWTARMVTFVVMLGFPIALVMAWALELTPEGIKKAQGNNLPVYVIAVALLALSIFWFVGKEESGTAPGTAVDASMVADAGSAEPAAIPSVAVLPFVNMSSDADNEYFADGMTEELLNLLVRIDGLRVPSRTSSFAFKGQNTDIREIASRLEVNHILEGSVRKTGNRIRVTAQLIDVETDTHLWSETYDRQLEDVFAIQDEIASEIVGALQLALTPSTEERKPTENMEAYSLYLQGLYQFQRRNDALVDAEKFLRQAVELDPLFAEAWAALALTYTVQPNYLFVKLDVIEPLALEAAARAEALNPELVEPALVRANLAGKRSRVLQSMKMYESAVQKQPKNALARLWFGIQILSGGYIQDAKEQLEIARDLDPAAGIILDWLSRAQYMDGQVDEAMVSAQRGMSLGRAVAASTLLHHYLDIGDGQKLQSLADQLPDVPFWESWGKILQVRLNPGLKDEVFAWLETSDDPDYVGVQWNRINLDQYLGDVDEALTLSSEAIAFDATILANFWWPDMKHVRAHPGFQGFAHRQGLVQLWQERGWPDLCRPLDEDKFECE